MFLHRCEEGTPGGVDGFGALGNALEHIPRTLKQTGRRWSWDPDRELAPGFEGSASHGFPHAIATGQPGVFQEKMARLIEAEITIAVESGEMRHHAAQDRGDIS